MSVNPLNLPWFIKTYNDLIESSKSKSKEDEYFEIHHIIPTAIGGEDELYNLVKLTPREHFIAHLLLAKIYGGKMIHAASMMSCYSKYTSKEYEWLKIEGAKEHSKALEEFYKTEKGIALKNKLSEMYKGTSAFRKDNHNSLASNIKKSISLKARYQTPEGKERLEKTRQRMLLYNPMNNPESRLKCSTSQKGKPRIGHPHDEEWRTNISKSLKGIPKSDEHKKKLSDLNKGKIQSEETKKKNADAVKAYWASPAGIARKAELKANGRKKKGI